MISIKGIFSEPVQQDEYTYSMKLESLELEKTPDDVYYEDGIRYICTEPSGLGVADEFLIYLPGIPMDNLPDTFALWLPAGDRTKETLPYYGIYNTGSESGFFAVSESENYRDNFINALLENENEWYNFEYEEFMFIDLNFDGKLEFVETSGVGATGTTMVAETYYYENGKARKANGFFTTLLTYNGLGSPTGYYDKVNKQYVMLGYTHYHADAANNWYGNFVLNFDNGKITDSYYSAKEVIGDFQSKSEIHYYDGANADADGVFADLFSSDCNEITEKEYNEINNKKLENLININMKCETINSSDWKNYSASEKRQALEKAYDAFSYDKYTKDTDSDTETDTDSETIEQDYTAVQLIDKTIPEIINIMGGEFDIDNEPGVYYTSDGWYFYNEDKLPGMGFYFTDYNSADLDNIAKLKNALKSGKYKLDLIRVKGEGKLDTDINADMNYTQCTRIWGDFNCYVCANIPYLGYDVPSNDGTSSKLILFFDLPTEYADYQMDDRWLTPISSDELHKKNPTLSHYIVKPGYSGTHIDPFDSETDSANGSSTNSSSTAAAATTGGTTANTANGKSAGAAVSTGAVTGAVFGIVVLAISGAVTLLAKKRKKS